MTPDERAARAAEAMWSGDEASRWMGMELDFVAEGTAALSIEVGARHCNGHGSCHGGVIFSLADSAFAFACNSRNQSTVAQHGTISFVAPARRGDRLTARAREVSLTGRNGIYDVTVRNQHDATVAVMRGMSRAVKGRLFEE